MSRLSVVRVDRVAFPRILVAAFLRRRPRWLQVLRSYS